MRKKTALYFAMMLPAFTPAASYAQDVCADSYMAAAIQREAAAVENATGICPTARAQIKLMKKSIAMIDRCRHMPDLMQLRPQYVQILKQAQEQANWSCS